MLPLCRWCGDVCQRINWSWDNNKIKVSVIGNQIKCHAVKLFPHIGVKIGELLTKEWQISKVTLTLTKSECLYWNSFKTLWRYCVHKAKALFLKRCWPLNFDHITSSFIQIWENSLHDAERYWVHKAKAVFLWGYWQSGNKYKPPALTVVGTEM